MTYQEQLNYLQELIKSYAGSDGKLSKNEAKKLNSDAATKILQFLVNNGEDISFKDKVTGLMRTGKNAIDGRVGDSTYAALDRTLARLNGYTNQRYAEDYKKKFGGTPTYNKVAGRSRQDAEGLANMYYDYYASNPEVYAGVLKNPKLGALTLPYLSDEAKSLLSELYMEGFKDAKTGATLNTPEMAYQGLLGSRGTQLQQQWEQANVRDAGKRFVYNSALGVGDLLGLGLRGVGMIANALADEPVQRKDGGLKLVQRFNKVTRRPEVVAVPDEHFTTVADVADILNGAGRFAVNLLTDPFSWLSMGPEFYSQIGLNLATNGKVLLLNLKTAYRYPGTPGALPVGGVGIQIPFKQLRDIGFIKQVKGSSGYNTVTKNSTQMRGGGAPMPKGNSGGTGWRLAYSPAPRLTVQSTGGALEWELIPQAVKPAPEFMPYYWDKVPMRVPYVAVPLTKELDYQLPNYVEKLPEGKLLYQYAPNHDTGGRDLIVATPEGQVVYEGPSANTLNVWRAWNPLRDTLPMWYGGMQTMSLKNGGNLTKKHMESLKYKGGPADGNSVQTNLKKAKKHRFGSKVKGADKITIIGLPDMFDLATFIN